MENLKTLTLKFGERLLGVLLFVVPGLGSGRRSEDPELEPGPCSKFCLGYLGLARHCYKGRGRERGRKTEEGGRQGGKIGVL